MTDNQNIDLKCEKCGCDYQKPKLFQEYLINTNHNVFYKWSLSFCDKCRKEKEIAALKSLPEIIKILAP